MWRSFFMAIGIFSVAMGIQFLLVEKLVLADAPRQTNSNTVFRPTTPMINRTRDFKPQEWLPWTLMSSGAIVILYSVGLGQRSGDKPAG